MFKNSSIDKDFLYNIKKAAIRATPKDTGNLAYNALEVRPNKSGFTVRYKSSVAGYGVFLNDYRKLRGFTAGKVNPHYLWFDNGVHRNVMNEITKKFTKNKTKKKDKVIQPTKRTYEDSSVEKRRISRQQNLSLKETENEKLQYQTLKDWNSRFEQFKNHNSKGWGI